MQRSYGRKEHRVCGQYREDPRRAGHGEQTQAWDEIKLESSLG